MYSLLDFVDYSIERRTEYSKPKVFIKKTGSVVGLCELQDKIAEYNNIEDFLNGKLGRPSMFSNCPDLISVNIPYGAKFIGWHTFCSCKNLVSITIPNSVTKISCESFVNCNCLAIVVIPDSVTRIGDGAFKGCASLKSIKLPDGIIEIGEKTFMECGNLPTINIPNSVVSIADEAFFKCKNLVAIKYKGHVYTSISDLTHELEVNDVYIGKNAFTETALCL